MSREREKERRASRERSLKLERKRYQQQLEQQQQKVSETRHNNDDITFKDRYTSVGSPRRTSSPIKRSQSGRLLERRSSSRDNDNGKPRALSFRYSPNVVEIPPPSSQSSDHNVVISTPKLAEKSAKYSETHFSVSETTSTVTTTHGGGVGPDNSLLHPPPLPARRFRGGAQRTSEPVLYPSMPATGGTGSRDFDDPNQRRSLQEVSD